MLTQVIIETNVPETEGSPETLLTLNVEAVNPDELLVVKSISGLTSTSATLFTGEFARDGGYYSGRRAGKRNPVLNLKINPNYKDDIEVSDIREMLYRTFMQPSGVSDGVRLRLVDDRRPDRFLVGYTETIETDAWVQEQVVQVSLICTDPYIRSVDMLSDETEEGWASQNVNYPGSAEAGFNIGVETDGLTNTVTLLVNGEKMEITQATNWDSGTTFFFSTVPGNRYVRQFNTDIIGKLTSDSVFPMFDRAVNVIEAYGSAPGDGKAKIMTYFTYPTWWGV